MEMRSAEVNGTKTKSLRYGRVKCFIYSKKSRARKTTLLGSKSHLWVFYATILRPLTSARNYANLSLPKKRKFRGADSIGQWHQNNLLQKIIRTSNRLLGSYYSGLVPKIGLEPIRSCPRRILSPLCLPFHHSGEREKTTGEPRCLLIGGTTQTRTGGKGFAGLCLTTWLWCHVGAGDETRTRDNYLGKVALYH